MRNIKTLFFLVITFSALNACQTVTTKIDKTTEQEKKELSQWLNKSENDLFSHWLNKSFSDLFSQWLNKSFSDLLAIGLINQRMI